MRLNLIFAFTQDGLFGINNKLPWVNCKEDLINFNRLTTDIYSQNTVVMGRNTYDSLPHILQDREMVVISSKMKPNEDVIIYPSLEEFIKLYKPKNKVFIIGGVKLIEECLTKYKTIIDTIYISEIRLPTIFGDNKVYINKELINPYLTNPVKKSNITFYKYVNEQTEEFQYLDLINNCITKGDYRQTRNGYTYSYFSDKISFDLKKGFPLLTTKKMFMKGIFEELIFFIQGKTNSKLLEDKNVNIWKWNTTKEFIDKCKLPYEEGDMGPMYGWQWRHFGADYKDCNTDYTNKGFDQIKQVLDLLINDSSSRRILLTDYNPVQAKEGVLYPCHSIVIQFYCNQIDEKKYISMNMYQRSVDGFLGLPFNITSNALFLHLICETLNNITQTKNYMVDKLNIIMGDIHIYEQHLEQVKEQLSRIPFEFPQLNIKNSYNNLEDYKWDDIEIINYQSHPTIKAQMIA